MTGNKLLEIKIEKVVNGGYGLGKIDGLVHLIPFAFPGDVVLIAPIQKQKNLVWAEIKSIIKESPYRKAKLCPQMGNCGACMWGMLDYHKQIELKKQLIEENIERSLKGKKVNVEIIYDENNQYHYRTRVIYHGDGKNLGFFKFHTKQIVDVSQCVITNKEIETIRRKLTQNNIHKDICITINPDTNKYMLYPPYINKYMFNDSNNHQIKIMDNSEDYFLYENVPIVNGCFSQNSLILNKILKNEVKKIIKNDQKILDLYCGSGNFTIDLDKERYVVGIDIDPIAIKRAKEFTTFKYQVGDENEMRKYLMNENWDTVLLDPPRTGAKKLIPYLKEAKSKKIVYISCETVNMCRDIKELSQKGWTIEKLIGVDMFPHTPHIESIVILKR
ncbi:MAG TPA: methyltransferase domain-containing protein [Candidatus Hydrogenedens sp.]|nr:methyltransferase domain-containing protein [Candidatus Hydrogenedens sp.]